MLMVTIGLVFGAPLAHAQTPATDETTQIYKPLKTPDIGEIPPLHPLVGLYQWDAQSYTLTTQADGSVVLSALGSEPQTVTTVSSRPYTADDKTYRLKQFATGLMLILGGILGLVSLATGKGHKPASGYGPTNNQYA